MMLAAHDWNGVQEGIATCSEEVTRDANR